jgi:hypothetical protein
LFENQKFYPARDRTWWSQYCLTCQIGRAAYLIHCTMDPQIFFHTVKRTNRVNIQNSNFLKIQISTSFSLIHKKIFTLNHSGSYLLNRWTISAFRKILGSSISPLSELLDLLASRVFSRDFDWDLDWD